MRPDYPNKKVAYVNRPLRQHALKEKPGLSHLLNPVAILIFSAMYGVLGLETEVEPNNLTLNTMSPGKIRAWAEIVFEQLTRIADLGNNYLFF